MELFAVPGLPEVREGDDLAALIDDAVDLRSDDVVCVASTVVSKAEGRAFDLDAFPPSPRAVEVAERLADCTGEQKDPRFAQAVLEESTELIMEAPFLLTATHFGHVGVNAGIDRSNVPNHDLLLLPKRPAESAARIRAALSAGRFGSNNRSWLGTFERSMPALTPTWPKWVAVRRNGASMISSVDSSKTACAKRGSFCSPVQSASRSATSTARGLGGNASRSNARPSAFETTVLATQTTSSLRRSTASSISAARSSPSRTSGRPGTANSSIPSPERRRRKTSPVPGWFDAIAPPGTRELRVA